MLDSAGMIALLEHWAKQYPIVSIEDGLAEDDWEGWTGPTARLGGSVQLRGDDLFATPGRPAPAWAIDRRAANAILIKLEPGRDPLRNTRRAPPGPPPRLPHDHLGALGRDRGYDHRRPRRCHGRRPDQDRLGRTLRTTRPSTTGSCGSRPTSAPRPASPAARRWGSDKSSFVQQKFARDVDGW